ncbi:hypothetical protein RYH80_00970 [Halobaculum sp. MBLA0147]|uniref:hypothetical protein n=1 Tax=Halobaculum sp. MBLA0147 TaxID=3079934 RepID=UPI003525DE23
MTLKLPRAETAADSPADAAWTLPQHARLIVYETDDGNELLTIYDCGAAQKPPSGQTVGVLGRVRADHELERTPTGYVVKMREPARLVRQETDPDHFVVERREG